MSARHLRLEVPENERGWAKILATLSNLVRLEDMSAKDAPKYVKKTAIPRLQWALELSDAQTEDLFEKAAEKNNPKKTAKKAKPGKRKAKAPDMPESKTEAIAEDKSGEEAPSRAVVKLPDIMIRAEAEAAKSEDNKEDAA